MVGVSEVDIVYRGEEVPRHGRFPKIVMIILLAEFCERFSYSGLRAFLTIYLKSKLMYSDEEATEIYHAFSCLIYIFPILGAVVADNYWGRFKTILCMMVIYAVGNAILAATAVPHLAMHARVCTMLGLLLISIGAGGIKPCVSAFGGDQFDLPRQERHLALYFSVLYFTLCFGSLVSKTISPILRSEIQCFGDKDCYSIAFGAPGVIMILSIAIFVGAKKLYVIKKPSGNILLDAMKCIWLGVRRKMKYNAKSKHHLHWLDATGNEYDVNFITDIKQCLSILMLFIPLPIFFALLDQLGSRWTLQASRMNGDFFWFQIRPDQMQVFCPLFILVIIPICHKVVYPCFDKYKIMFNPLHKLTLGGFLMCLAVTMSGLVELHIKKTYPVLPQKHFAQMRIYNGYSCSVTINNTEKNIFATIAPYSMYTNKNIPISGVENITTDIECECGYVKDNVLLLEENNAVSFYIAESGVTRYIENIRKSRSGLPYVRFLIGGITDSCDFHLFNEKRNETEISIFEEGVSSVSEVYSSTYSFLMKNRTLKRNISLQIGGVYVALIQERNNDTWVCEVLTVTPANSVSMLLLIPQYFFVSAGEVLFAITGMEFSFKEAPESMKSVIQASWLATNAIGNVIIIVMTRLAHNFDQAMQSFIYSTIGFTAMVIFYFLAENYESIAINNNQNNKCDYAKVEQLHIC